MRTMWREALVVVCVGVAVAAAGRSPHADLVETLYKQYAGGRMSDDILRDAAMDVPELVRTYNYPLEEHTVTTEDGYILGMHRIPHGRDRNNQPGPRPVVFLMHGLFSSSADWVVIGPGTAFAYMLAEEGFDVWMGNARGTFYSRRHLTLNPDATFNVNFWRFSWHEIGNRDLPAMIDYALAHTGRDALHYVGHSQGTTSFFAMGSTRPEYNRKIISMHAYAPVAYMAYNESPLLSVLSRFASNIERALALIGIGEFLPNSEVFSWAGRTFCEDDAVFQPLCSNMLFLLAGRSECQLNATLIPLKLGHTPAGAASRQLVHYAQGISGGEFRLFDHGNAIANMREHGRIRPPHYELRQITAPVFLHYSLSDPLAHINDVNRLYRELGRPVGKFRIPLETFSHIDFIWGINAKDLLYSRTINLIKSIEANGFADEELMKFADQE